MFPHHAPKICVQLHRTACNEIVRMNNSHPRGRMQRKNRAASFSSVSFSRCCTCRQLFDDGKLTWLKNAIPLFSGIFGQIFFRNRNNLRVPTSTMEMRRSRILVVTRKRNDPMHQGRPDTSLQTPRHAAMDSFSAEWLSNRRSQPILYSLKNS